MENNVILEVAGKLAHNFTRTYKVEYREVVQEGYLAGMEAVLKFDSTRGASVKTFLYAAIRNHLCNWVKQNIPEPVDEIVFEFVPDTSITPEMDLLRKEAFSHLSDSAKEVFQICIKKSGSDNKTEIKNILKADGWSWPKIYDTFRELKEYCSAM